MWMEITVERMGDDIRVGARDSRELSIEPRTLGPGCTMEHLRKFAAAVQSAAEADRPVVGPLLEAAEAIDGALLGGQVDVLRARLQDAAGGRMLVRLRLSDAALKSIPWEALHRLGDGAKGFWGTSGSFFPVRSVPINARWVSQKVRGPLRVLAIAPEGGHELVRLREVLSDAIAMGEVEWLEPLEGGAARVDRVLECLKQKPMPDIVHFIGHGGIVRGAPALKFADYHDDEQWIAVETLAQRICVDGQSLIRLVILEACEGARAGDVFSAAELLAMSGVDAVIAHLWPVRADIGLACSQVFYRALAGTSRSAGDVAASLNEARALLLARYGQSACAFSPVLYLRSLESTIFNYEDRSVRPPQARSAVEQEIASRSHELGNILRQNFSLLLGDRNRSVNDPAPTQLLHDRIHKELSKGVEPVSHELPLSALAELFALRRGQQNLTTEFQRVFSRANEPMPLTKALARVVGPGVHTTLLRDPQLEIAVAESQPKRRILVVQPDAPTPQLFLREPGNDWESVSTDVFDPEKPGEKREAIDVSCDIVILRLYSGYTPELLLAQPLLTEDDYLFRLRDIDANLPRDLADPIIRALATQPTLAMNISLLEWPNRVMLHRVFPRGFSKGSVAVVGVGDSEGDLWKKGLGFSGSEMLGRVAVVELPLADLVAALHALAEERGT